MTATLSAPEQITNMPAKQEQKTFVLPADIIYIAAQFASKEKHTLCGISIKPVFSEADNILTSIEVCSTDGHRMFRCSVPTENTPFFLDKHVVINAEPFKKKVAKASTLHLSMGDELTMALFFGFKSELIQSIPYTVVDCDYPDYNKLWPIDFHNNSGHSISFNANYLAAFLKQVEAYCSKSIVTMNCNSPTTPMVFSANHSIYSSVTLEYLLMPVQLRS